jgi:hypothetical protein
MHMRGTKRPYKVTYHYDAGGLTLSGTVRERAIDATDSSHELCKVRSTARVVSRNGGSANVWRYENTDDTTSEKVILRHYEPYEVAMDDLIQDGLDELMYGAY